MSISSTTLINTLPTLLSSNCQQNELPTWPLHKFLYSLGKTWPTRGLVQSSNLLYSSSLQVGWDGGNHCVEDGL